jgi:hypothetical protein
MFAGKLSCETAFPFKSPTTRFEGVGHDEVLPVGLFSKSSATGKTTVKCA